MLSLFLVRTTSKVNIKLDQHSFPEDVFESHKEFLEYFREMTAVLMNDEEYSKKNQGSLSYLIPNIMELNYIKDLKQPRLFFPKFSNKVIVQLPEENFQTEKQKSNDIISFSSIVKAIEMDIITRFSVIKKLFELRQNLK